MTTSPPIACSLTATDLQDRLDAMSALGRRALVETTTTTARRAELRFKPGVRDRLDRIVEAEAQCCAFLTMTVTGDATLIIEAPEGAEPVLDGIVQAFAGS